MPTIGSCLIAFRAVRQTTASDRWIESHISHSKRIVNNVDEFRMYSTFSPSSSDARLNKVEGGHGLNVLVVNANLVQHPLNDTVVPDLATWEISRNSMVRPVSIPCDRLLASPACVSAVDYNPDARPRDRLRARA